MDSALGTSVIIMAFDGKEKPAEAGFIETESEVDSNSGFEGPAG